MCSPQLGRDLLAVSAHPAEEVAEERRAAAANLERAESAEQRLAAAAGKCKQVAACGRLASHDLPGPHNRPRKHSLPCFFWAI